MIEWWMWSKSWKLDGFDGLKEDNLLWKDTCFGRLKVEHFFSSRRAGAKRTDD